MQALYNKFVLSADFLLVYIREAHAQDEWPQGRRVCLNQPRTNDERKQAALLFRESHSLTIPLVMDGISDAFEAAFAAWPEQFFVVDDAGRLMFKAEVGPAGFDQEVLKRLEQAVEGCVCGVRS